MELILAQRQQKNLYKDLLISRFTEALRVLVRFERAPD